MSYTDPRTEHTYNMLLNGRWHTGYTPDVAGQLDVEQDIIKHSGMNQTSKVLDFGCGNGLVTYDYYVMTGATVHGVTNNKSQFNTASALIDAVGASDHVSFTLLEEDWRMLPFAQDHYDIVVFTESPCHVKDKLGLFRELKRVLKPGGRIVGMDWGYQQAVYRLDTYVAQEDIEKAYGVYLLDTLGYINIAGVLNMPCSVSNYIPQWDIGIFGAIKSRLRSMWYSWKYPTLLIDSPFKVDSSQINHELVNHGKLLEYEGFKLFMVVFHKYENES